MLAPFLYFALPVILNKFFIQYFIQTTIDMLKILVILIPGRITAAIVNQSHTIATGNSYINMYVMIPAGLANVVLDLLFICIFGFMGVIYATVVCILFSNITFMILYYFKLRGLGKNGIQ